MKYLSLPFDVFLSETYASFSTPASVVFRSKCTEIRLRIPMWGYEIRINNRLFCMTVVTNSLVGGADGAKGRRGFLLE